MLNEFVKSVKENPVKSMLEMITLLAVFAFGYVLLVLGAILTGNI